MKRTGFRPPFAAAIEAVASTGGQLMPPVMGIAAFVMADIMGVPYAKIALAATIPATTTINPRTSSLFFIISAPRSTTGSIPAESAIRRLPHRAATRNAPAFASGAPEAADRG